MSPLGDFPAAVSEKWSAYAPPAMDTFDKGTYNPGKVVSIADGVLNKYIHAEDGEFLVAALLPKVPGTKRHGQMYGRYAVRFKMDRIEGYKVGVVAVARQRSLASAMARSTFPNEVCCPTT